MKRAMWQSPVIATATIVAVAPCVADNECSMALAIRDDRSVIVRTFPERSEIDIWKLDSSGQPVGLNYSVARKDGKKSLRARLPRVPGAPLRATLTVGATATENAPVSGLKPNIEATAKEEFDGVDLTTFSATLADTWKEGKDARLVIFAADQPAVDLFLDGRVYKRAMAEMQLEMDIVFANAATGKCATGSSPPGAASPAPPSPPPSGGGGNPIVPEFL